ncbi:glycosyl hydrolase [Luteitalea sp.]
MRRGVRSGRVAAMVVLALWLGAQAMTQAQTAAAPAGGDLSVLSTLKWRNVGPARGGRSIAVAGSVARPLEYFFGATGGGLWKTTDGGLTWAAVGDGQFKTSSVGAVAVAPSNPDVVYVGFGEVQLRGNVIQGDGVYKSTDGGKTFAAVGLAATRTIGRIRVHPANPDIVWVAALGEPYAKTPDRGVYKSTDGGKAWTRVLSRDDGTGAVDLVVDPTNPEVLYASLWEVSRTPHSLSSGGPGSGLFKSFDGGTTWTEITRRPGLPTGLLGKIGVSVSGADGNRVYAIIEAADGGLFASDDGGLTWTRVSEDRNIRQRAFYYTRVYADPKSRDTVYVLNVNFHKSTDGGKTFKSIRVPHGDNHDLWIAADNPQRMVQANDGGANVSINGGTSWTGQQYATSQFYNAFTTSDTPYMICGAQQDNTTACISSNGPASDFYPVGGGESGYIAQSNVDPDVFFAGSYGGMLTRFNRRTKVSRAVNIWPDNPMGYSAGDIRERFQWTYPIVFSPLEKGVVYASSQHVWRSTTGGDRWERISPDLTRHDPTTLGPSGGPITLDQTGVETYATVFTVAPSRLERGVIWAGSDDGLVHVTRDAGKTWKNITPTGLPEFARVSLIEASPHKAGTAYLAANRYQKADRAPYVFRTDDYGATWTPIVGGLPGDDFARVIREDTVRAGLLYLGTEQGLYISYDNGGAWQSLRLNLPVTPIHGIVVQGNDLVVGTHGRAFWVLDDIAALRQFSPDLASRPLHVFAPGVATRRLEMTLPIDYLLQADAKAVSIEILDAQGQVVRTVRNEADRKPAAGAGDDEEGFGPPPARVTTKKGMNRFAWDMRMQAARDFPGLIMWAGRVAGPIVVPGRYQARVTADGQTQTVPIEIRADPRSRVLDADLKAQYALARRINARVNEANETVLRLRHIKQQIEARMKATADLAPQGSALVARLTEIEGEIYQYRNRSSQDPLNYPIRLNNKLAALQGVVEAGDGAPTAQSVAVFEDLSARLDAQLRRVDAAVGTDVAAFNATLASKQLAPVVTTVPTLEEVAAMGTTVADLEAAVANERTAARFW